MATRPIFVPTESGDLLVKETPVSFHWSPGFAPSQKQKNVAALHDSAKELGLWPLLEISTKSHEKLGRRLSAFSLQIRVQGREIPFESAYQGSKVFRDGGPYTDLYNAEPRDAKRDPRIRTSGPIVGFELLEQIFPNRPLTAFYDWLYINALSPHREFLLNLRRYRGFTDIEFNPERSLNCQARACALLVALEHRGLLDETAHSFDRFVQETGPQRSREAYARRDGELPL